jgi:hypothetical protein
LPGIVLMVTEIVVVLTAKSKSQHEALQKTL